MVVRHTPRIRPEDRPPEPEPEPGFDVRHYNKFIVAVSGALSVAVTDGLLDTNDAITIVLAGLAALGVYRVPNKV